MRLLPRRVSARAKSRIKIQNQTPLGHKTTHRYKHSSGGAWLALCDAAALVVVMSPRTARGLVVCCVACGSRRRGGGRGGGVGLARSRAWGGRFGDVACAGLRVIRPMRASFGFGFGFDGSVRRGTAAAACHPKLASSCRRVAMSPLGGLGLARSRARGGGGGCEPRAHNAPSSGRTGG